MAPVRGTLCNIGGITVLMLPRTVDLYAAWLGILKAGAAVNTIDLGKTPPKIARAHFGGHSPKLRSHVPEP